MMRGPVPIPFVEEGPGANRKAAAAVGVIGKVNLLKTRLFRALVAGIRMGAKHIFSALS